MNASCDKECSAQWNEVISCGNFVLKNVIETSERYAVQLDEEVYVTYAHHVELTSRIRDIDDTRNLLYLCIERCPSSFEVHFAVQRAFDRHNPLGLLEEGKSAYPNPYVLGSYTLTFSIISVANRMWQKCAVDLACLFLASIVHADEVCPLFPSHSSVAIYFGSNERITLDHCLRHFETNCHFFLGMPPSSLVDLASDGSSDNSCRKDIVWASFIYMLFTGNCVPTSLLCEQDIESDFIPQIDWYELCHFPGMYDA